MGENVNEKYEIISTFSYKVIYVFKIYDELHEGILKIGESTLISSKNVSELTDNCYELNDSASKRIKQYTNTIGVQEDLLYTTLAIDKNNKFFKDKDVHFVLENSGIKKHDFENTKNPQEWYEVNLETVINAINAVKNGRYSLTRSEVSLGYKDIEFRPEQLKAIEKTLNRFTISDRMLWNAKMRFGKTLSALEVIKRMSRDEKFNLKRAIILTHRPVVDEGWFDDFSKIFYSNSDFLYGSKKKTSIQELIKSNQRFIYFASIQDLRGSGAVGGKFNKNDDVFSIDWDLVVIDEAHEGTQTSLGSAVLHEIIKEDSKHCTKQLFLSGTPFNLLHDFDSEEIYTWDYIMEQKAKIEWEQNNPLEPNPYDDLPRLNILTYNLYDFLPIYKDVADNAFNFREFFRVWTGDSEKDGKELPSKELINRFVHEQDVEKFLVLLTKQDSASNYPFSKQEYIENFRHSFWILPGVKEAAALKKLMLKNPVFSTFEIVNVAGTGDDTGYEALESVERAIGSKPEETYTITLSCGKLTTGVTIKPWTAVLYLSGSYSTSASSYLQSIFRVQSPANIGGKQKTDCYVFDFAPDRTLKMVAAAGSLAIRSGETGSTERMKQFLNFCPVISVNGSNMEPYDVSSMLQQLKQAYIERVVDNGFDDVKMYNDNLYKLDENALSKFEKLKGIIGATKQKKKINSIDINEQGFNQEQWQTIKKIEKKPKRERTEEERRLLEELRKKREQKNNAISILRGISIRIPLLIYGAELNDNEDVTIDNFTKIVDDVSWEEFMPKGVTKEIFNDFVQYYDPEIFIGAGRRIRNIAKHADTLNPIERAKSIADLFATFRNPDKETVLTPWKTVNRHMGDTLGGYNFFDEHYMVSIEEPRLINNGEVTNDVLFNTNSKILEINSKTGLYPLYVTISLFRQRCLNTDDKKLTDDLMKALWNQTIEENIFVICKTPMAKSITNRTLIGFNKVTTNVISYELIIDDLKVNVDKMKCKVLNPNFWGYKGSDKMKFDVIIGNPPYQESVGNDGGNSSKSKAIYNLFMDAALSLRPKYISLITPSRWMTKSTEGISDKWVDELLSSNNFICLYDYLDSTVCFSNVEIKGGVSYFLYKFGHNDECYYHLYNGDVSFDKKMFLNGKNVGVVIRDEKGQSIIEKINSIEKDYLLDGNNFSVLVSPKDYFTNKEKLTSSWTGYSKESSKNNNIVYYFNQKGKSMKGYVGIKDIPKNTQSINKHKVLIPAAGGSGNDSFVLGRPFYAEPNSVCSQTYLFIGYSHELSKMECDNICKYINTKFFRYLVSLKKKTQNGPKMVYQFVPLQDFSCNSDIDWTLDLLKLDEQLFKKYNLSVDEIVYIQNKIDYL